MLRAASAAVSRSPLRILRPFSSFATPKVHIRRTEALINGEWIKTKQTFETINPANEEKLADVAHCGKAEGTCMLICR